MQLLVQTDLGGYMDKDTGRHNKLHYTASCMAEVASPLNI